MKIYITRDWAAEITVCTNLETLGILNNKDWKKILHEVLQAGGAVFGKHFGIRRWEFVKQDSYWRRWNNGGIRRAKVRSQGHFAFKFITRDPDDYWYDVTPDMVPSVLQVGLEAILEACTAAMDSVVNAYANPIPPNLKAGLEIIHAKCADAIDAALDTVDPAPGAAVNAAIDAAIDPAIEAATEAAVRAAVDTGANGDAADATIEAAINTAIKTTIAAAINDAVNGAKS